ncbi:DUF485 domain-containing protein [Streptomyces sp. NPDC126499]|uniref:DUF485 domain-containing protein n=1 Tax=Streptomyces sp. NPDC126499 TaxID=3155314 RepID=UPI00331756F5
MEKQEGRDPAAVGIDDPWYDELAAGWGEHNGDEHNGDEHDGEGPVGHEQGGGEPDGAVSGRDGTAAPHLSGTVPRQHAADIYLEVQRSPAFQDVRSRYRRFVFPAALAFLLWYLAYVVAATAAPGLMARPVAGAVNVAMLAGLGQFATTFLLTWAYARHARRHRDRAALELRWDTQEMTRGVRR